MTTGYIQAMQVGLDVKAALETLHDDLLTNSVNATGVQANLNTNRGTIVADLTAIRTGVIAALTAVAALATAVNTLATKLNADAGVTDANYAASNATNQVATSSPAALTTST